MYHADLTETSWPLAAWTGGILAYPLPPHQAVLLPL